MIKEYFSTIQTYEAVLMILGVVLFLTLIFGFIWLLIKDKLKSTYWFGFLVPIIMIGFANIELITLGKDTFTVKMKTQKVLNNPDSFEFQLELENALNAVPDSSLRSPKQAEILVEANLVLGRLDHAEKVIKKAEEENKVNDQIIIHRDWINENREKLKVPTNPNNLNRPLKPADSFKRIDPRALEHVRNVNPELRVRTE